MQRYEYIRGQEIPGTSYIFIRRLDEGGQGEIYEVESRFPKKRWVMKLPILGTKVAEEMFMQEGQVLSALDHDNIVAALPGGTTAEIVPRRYFIMPRLYGKPLDVAIEEWDAPFDIRTTAGTIIPVLEALIHAHGKGVIHGDLKPGNIFMEARETDGATRVMVIDFGLAQVFERLNLMPAPPGKKRLMCTPKYAAPEQLEGAPTFATDIHAVGLIMFRMLADRNMFDEAEMEAETGSVGRVALLVNAVLTMKRLRVSWFVDEIPPELDDLVFRMTAIDPADRPTPQEAIECLRGVVNRLPVREENPASVNGVTGDTVPKPIDALLAGTHANITGDRSPLAPAEKDVTKDVTKNERLRANPVPVPEGQSSIIIAEPVRVEVDLDLDPEAARIFSTQPDPGPPDFDEVPTVDPVPVAIAARREREAFRNDPTTSFKYPAPRERPERSPMTVSPMTVPLGVMQMPATLRSAEAETVEIDLPGRSAPAAAAAVGVYRRLLWLAVIVGMVVLAWIVWSTTRTRSTVGRTWSLPTNIGSEAS